MLVERVRREYTDAAASPRLQIGLLHIGQQAEGVSGQSFAFFGCWDFDTAEIAIAVLT